MKRGERTGLEQKDGRRRGRGERLDRTLREAGPFPPTEALDLGWQLADALARAHERGRVHGALSPASVHIRRDGPPRAMLRGFARAARAPRSAARPPYAPPERLAGGQIDARSDVFALGLLLFEMLEGRPLLAGAPDAVIGMLLHETGPILPRFSCIMPSGVASLVARAVRRSPAHRQQSMAQLRAEIEACLRRLGQSCGPDASRRPRSASRHVGIAVDEALDEREDDLTVAPTSSSPADGASIGRVLLGAPQRGSRRGLVLTCAIFAAAVEIAFAWPFFRTILAAPTEPPRALAPPRDHVPSAPPAASAPAEAAPARAVVALEPPPTVSASAAAAEPVRSGPLAAVAKTATPPVPDVAPRIVSWRPLERDAIGVGEGGAITFAAEAADQDPDDRLAYVWHVDGRQVARGQTWRFVAPAAATTTTHTVELRVTDRAGLSAPPVSWTVEITPRMWESDVRAWLDGVAAAWRRGDLEMLRLQGIVTSDVEAQALRKRVARDGEAHVTIANETIQTDGKYATVMFDRADFDGKGKLLSSRRQSYALEKRPDGFIALRARPE
jgi:serine/threonine-protein kinase